jgi:ketol-acid reductoisomerase
MAENDAGIPNLLAARRQIADHPIEEVGQRLREMMPFLVEKKPEDDV